MSTFIAVDWGTTNRRAYRVENGRVVVTERDGLGVKALVGGRFEDEVAGLRHRLGDLPMQLAGMVGSTIGWREVPYVAAPASIASLAANLCWMDDRTAIVPGVVDETRPDVMRGEEVQILGAHAAGSVPADALVCQPGTHCKWATVQGGAIKGFATAMTGELFGLLKDHSILAAQLKQPISDLDAFDAGLVAAAQGDLLSQLFGIRAQAVLGRRSDATASSFASGLLIGTDVKARDVRGKQVYLLADPELGKLYARAVSANGGTAVMIESTAAFVAGATAIQGYGS